MTGTTASELCDELRAVRDVLQALHAAGRLSASRDPSNTRWTDLDSAVRSAQTGLDVAVDALAWVDTDVEGLARERPTATARGTDGLPLDRDDYARALSEQADPTGPAEGDRVRLTYGDGSTVEGRWAFVGGDVEGPALLTDAGSVHAHVTGQVRRDVLERATRPRLPLLTHDEAVAAAALLDELAGVYPGEQLGSFARDLAVRLYDRLGI